MAERDERGRFIKGEYRGGPGRPKRSMEYAYLKATVEAVSVADWRKVVIKALKQAILGDDKARTWLSNYLLGKPPQIIELRADDAAVLADLLAQLETEGIPASQLFEAMFQELAAASADDV